MVLLIKLRVGCRQTDRQTHYHLHHVLTWALHVGRLTCSVDMHRAAAAREEGLEHLLTGLNRSK